MAAAGTEATGRHCSWAAAPRVTSQEAASGEGTWAWAAQMVVFDTGAFTQKRRVCWRCKSSLMLPQTIPPRIHDGVGAPEPDAGKRPAHCSECLRGSKLSPSLLIMKLLLSLQVCMRCSLPKGGSLYGSSPGEDRYSQPL